MRRTVNTLLCRLLGHDWRTVEITGFHPDGRQYVRGTKRLCVRCPARLDVVRPQRP